MTYSLALSYQSDLIKPYIPTQTWHSQNSEFRAPKVQMNYRAPFLWNNLPADIRQSGSIEALKSKLKTCVFDMTVN